MKPDFKVIERPEKAQVDWGPYEEIAFYVRQLLNCDYALVALTDKSSIRVHCFAGEVANNGGLAEDLLLQLRDWAPVIVDDGRLIAVPVSSGEAVVGVLVGYASEAGTFSSEHLEKLKAYAPVAACMIVNVGRETDNTVAKPTFRPDELFHFFRLITIGEFSACFAHEVRNPLTLIQGHVRCITENLTADHPMRSNVDAIDRASRRIEDMAKRMLDFSKKRTCHAELCDIRDLISDALRFVQPYIRVSLTNVEAHFDPNLPQLELDRWQMLQAIVNILQNASDAMANSQRRVLSIDAIARERCVEIIVSDTGTGISAAHLSKIFEPFFTTKNERGTGLGLYITKQVVEEHRGTVRVESSNQGTTFTISLPLYAGT